MIGDDDHLFMCLLASCMSSLEKCLCLLPIFKLDYLGVSLVLSCRSSLYILGTNTLSDMSFANIFSHTKGCLLVLLIVSFTVQKF